ncbi:hypothetical protein BASA81_011127 [Batrachochytrium salamandrivorans]|nr:hypothetical protein BASA81_011127 [Batrachochytrium salamandrivorans]
MSFAPKFVLGDDEGAYPKEIFLNPQTFVAGANLMPSSLASLCEGGESKEEDRVFVRNWGMTVTNTSNAFGRCSNGPSLYTLGCGPKAQWAKQRAACILSQIKQCRELESQLVVSNRALVLRISMRHLYNEVYREVVVPAVMPLYLLAKQVLLPCMGFFPQQKSWCFTRGTDGARFGPDLDALDMDMHSDWALLGYNQAWFIPANQVCANDLFRVEGSEAIELEYDFYRSYRMLVQLKVVLDCKGEDKVNDITVLSGQGACPPEGGQGLKPSQEYHEYFKAWESMSFKQRLKPDSLTQAREMAMAPNIGYGPTPQATVFDCLNGFDLESCNDAVQQLTNIGPVDRPEKGLARWTQG